MNRVAQCIKMLVYLRTVGSASTKELAQVLHTKERNIREYKNELTEAGYSIESVRGRNGGYALVHGDTLSLPSISADEEKLLTSSIDFINSQPGFAHKEEFAAILSRLVYAASNKTEAQKTAFSYRGNPTAQIGTSESQMLDTVQEAIEEGVSLVLNYQGRNKEQPSKVEVDPYKIIFIDGSYYLIGWSHTARDYRNYRFSSKRMLEVSKTKRCFMPDNHFRLEDYIGSTSAFKGKLFLYHVQVTKNQTRFFEEMYWGSDLKKEEFQEGWQTYSFYSDDQYYVFASLFKMGSDIRLLGPKQAVDDFKDKVDSISRMYERDAL
ncbi:MAG: WYL domain-containing transcriptional regulator [Ileibacterium sp.]|nr:WYL domain-containing transcriptional regulator [Ileibacterium sp.]